MKRQNITKIVLISVIIISFCLAVIFFYKTTREAIIINALDDSGYYEGEYNYPKYEPSKPTEFIIMPKMFYQSDDDKYEYYIVRNPPSKRTELLRKISEYNMQTLTIDSINKYKLYKRGYYRESNITTIDYEEDNGGFSTDYLLRNHKRDFLLELEWTNNGSYINLEILYFLSGGEYEDRRYFEKQNISTDSIFFLNYDIIEKSTTYIKTLDKSRENTEKLPLFLLIYIIIAPILLFIVIRYYKGNAPN